MLFALGARDFFRFFALKHGDAIFREGGTLGKQQTWKGGDHEFQLWSQGRTGFPFIDANMRELLASGFMSNRGRQNVASFLILDLGVDWRRGADWFESHLVDHDVTANWCNWVFAAGLTGGRINRFNILRQAKNYDPEGTYVRQWVPELEGLPQQFIHEPWLMSEQERTASGAQLYPEPCIDPSTFSPDTGPVPVQLKGLKGRGRGAKSTPKGRGYGESRPETQDGQRCAQQVDTQSDRKPEGKASKGTDQNASAPRRWKSSRETPPVDESFEGPSWLRS